MVKIVVNPQPERYLNLFKEAGAEVGIDYVISPDWESYKALIDCGDYLFIGAEQDDEPIGYIGILFTTSLFNRDVRFAIVDSFFVKPLFRAGITAGRLLSKAEGTAWTKAGRMVFQCETDNPLAAMLLKRGFKVIDSNFEKVKHG